MKREIIKPEDMTAMQKERYNDMEVGKKIEYQMAWIEELPEMEIDFIDRKGESFKLRNGCLDNAKYVSDPLGMRIDLIISDLDDYELYENEHDVLDCLENWLRDKDEAERWAEDHNERL